MSSCHPFRHKKSLKNSRIYSGAKDEARTRDNRYHKPGLYQLSYFRHQMILSFYINFIKMSRIICNPLHLLFDNPP